MTVSPGSGASSGMISQPGSPRTRIFPHGPGIADAGADALAAPALVRRQIGEIGAMSLARVHDVIALRAGGGEHVLNRPDRRAGQRQVVAHLVDVAALAAEVGLHVDDQARRCCRDADRRCTARDTDRLQRGASCRECCDAAGWCKVQAAATAGRSTRRRQNWRWIGAVAPLPR